MFSIEAFFAVAIIILAIGIFAYNASANEVTTNNTQIQSQAQGQMMLYFNWAQKNPNYNSIEQYCKKIITFNYATKSLIDKNSCLVIK